MVKLNISEQARLESKETVSLSIASLHEPCVLTVDGIVISVIYWVKNPVLAFALAVGHAALHPSIVPCTLDVCLRLSLDSLVIALLNSM